MCACGNESVIDIYCEKCFFAVAIEGEDYIRHKSGVIVIQLPDGSAKMYDELVGMGF